MTPADLQKIQSRIDAVGDARLSANDRYKAICMLQWNAWRDLTRCMGRIAELERDNRILREMRATSEHVTTYSAQPKLRPANSTIRPDLLMKAGSVDLPILAPVEDDISLGELVRGKITGLVDVIEEWEHRRGR